MLMVCVFTIVKRNYKVQVKTSICEKEVRKMLGVQLVGKRNAAQGFVKRN